MPDKPAVLGVQRHLLIPFGIYNFRIENEKTSQIIQALSKFKRLQL